MELGVLIYLTTGQDAFLTQKLLDAAQIKVRVCRGPRELATRLSEGVGALLLAEEVLGGTEGVLRQFIVQQPTWSDLPVLLLTKNGMDSLEIQSAVEHLGNVTLLERPVRTMALLSFVKSALRARERQYQVRAFNQRKDEFLATLAHELRNPLAPILNAAGIFERLYPSAQTTKLVDMVNRQIKHLTRLVDDLMEVARINTGKIELQPAKTSVAQVVSHALEIADASLRERRHQVAVLLPQPDIPLHADHVRLVQSLANIIVNAAKFTPPEGKISVTAEVDGVSAFFRVKDSGKGLSKKGLASIFHMFAQERAAGEPSTGLGIGLHLAKVFTEMHGGSISASSPGLGQGSEFTIQVPITPQGHPLSFPAAPTVPAVQNLPRHVLVVDDNQDAADSLAEFLALQGIEVSVVYDGHSAVSSVCQRLPNAVVMDIGMPGMNGYDTAREIRRLLPGKQPLLIALTGWGQHADRSLARDAGFDFHFVKPVNVQRLLACLGGPSDASGI
ncbi:His Kinase A (phospho-acceptor) domain-containing protein [Rhodoferax sp. OV413]|uniref:hybrid sensor histidine kinase/response regulator n=1 Tax=Rhodoferax sp. OV413 TaxID=1855285 RepID=UPI00088D499B|nr:response regulator [Rhodoferax sp. OV413]SDO69977.1 His Kinase A (phospho-acceptor) domain-containing protein [Rhodoferax sp. OV413]